MLDYEHSMHENLNPTSCQTYFIGHVSLYNVAITCLPAGTPCTTPALMVATDIQQKFHIVRVGLLIGNGSGVLSAFDHIQLGDEVVSKPTGDNVGVLQFKHTRSNPNPNCFSCPFLPTPAKKLFFAYLCDAFSKSLLLAHLYFARPIHLDTDALGIAKAGIILQQQDNVCKGSDSAMRVWELPRTDYLHSVPFWSRSMSPGKQNYAISNQ